MQFGQSTKGNDQIAIDLLLATGETVTAFLNFSDAARPYSEERLVALGWAGLGHPLDEAELTREVDVDIKYEEYQGKQQMRVDIVGNGGRVKLKTTMDDAQKSAFLARLTGVKPGAAKLDF
jgi:hypothetical protein